ncbi:MAG: hypothetical protein GJV46_02925 [Geobacter sp.]|nr:hypothetical protein [Geobacter sp.]
MEIFGGFMVMMSIIGLFLAVIWIIMPFVVFAIKGKQDRTLEVLEGMEKRLASLEAGLRQTRPDFSGNFENPAQAPAGPTQEVVSQAAEKCSSQETSSSSAI